METNWIYVLYVLKNFFLESYFIDYLKPYDWWSQTTYVASYLESTASKVKISCPTVEF